MQLVAPKSTWHDKDHISNAVFTISTRYFFEFQPFQHVNFSHNGLIFHLSPQGVNWPGWKDEFVLKWHGPMKSMPSSHPGKKTDDCLSHWTIGPPSMFGEMSIEMTMKLVKT